MLQIITDTASDITAEQAKQMNIHLVPIDILFEDGACPQETEADFDTFYQRLQSCRTLPTTSRPSPQAYADLYLYAKMIGDDVLVLTLSSGLSGTYESAVMAKDVAQYGRVWVVDTHQAILTQRMLVEYAVQLRAEGVPVQEIVRRLEAMRDRVTVCGVLNTLKYLRMGGRIPAGLAVIGEMLKIKPVIILKDLKLQTLGKARSYHSGTAMLHTQMEKDGWDPDFPVCFGYTSDREITEAFMQETIRKYGLTNTRVMPIGGIIGTHCGTDCVAVAYVKKAVQ